MGYSQDCCFFFFQAEDGIRDHCVTGVQTCALPISRKKTGVRASPSVICIGAGPAGLTAAYLLSKRGVPVTVIERDPVHVGGIARTVQHAGFRFEIGGHRFFSKSSAVEALWSEVPRPALLQPLPKTRTSASSTTTRLTLKRFGRP